jgi:hypothetical protein
MAEDVTRRTLLAGAGTIAAGAAVTGSASAAAKHRTVGAVRGDRDAIELIGRLVQEEDAITGFGYLTYISGLPEAVLFVDPANRSEASARFRFHSNVTATARFLRPNLISVSGTGDLRIYFGPPRGANFDAPGSFETGGRIATYHGRFENLLSVIAPEQGLTTVAGDLSQRSARAFRLGGHRYRLGRAGLRQRLEASGPGRKNTDPSARKAVFEVGGALVVAD